MPLRKRFELEYITEGFEQAWTLLNVVTGPDGNTGSESITLALEFFKLTPPLIKEGTRHCMWLNEIFAMNLEIRDGKALNRINPDAIWYYVEEHGWVVSGESEIARYMTHPDSEESFTLPKTRDVGDYSLRMKDAIVAMSLLQGKSQLLIWMELVH